MFRHLGDLLTIKILKGRIKKEYCQDSDILGFCENYLKLLHALYNCAADISNNHDGDVAFSPGFDVDK